MKRILPLLLCLLLSLSACSSAGDSSASQESASAPDSSVSESSGEDSTSSDSSAADTAIGITDSEGTSITLYTREPRVVSLYGSYAEAWLLAGGQLVGVTQDAIDERQLDLSQDVDVVGSVKEPNVEEVLALEPDLVILSSDIANQVDLKDTLENAGLTCAYYRVDTFEDYDFLMEQFCAVTGRDDLYEENVTQVEGQIEEVKAKAAQAETGSNVLLIRAFSTGIKAKTDDELAGVILKDLGTHNIADDHPSMLEDLSLEEVISADPDYIFVTTMGDEQKALDYLDSLIAENPAWSELTAVKEGRYVVLPKDLFHYKPNNR
ncbi:MAG: ABC transporter substrate-binding protein, partial [Acutalibacter sp.]